MPDAASSAAKTKFAIKTALSLTLAYMLPMAMGWPQPQTAAITVMLIAATGLVSDSLQKGVLRVMGTVLGAVIGLGLIALFPQDRMLYLFAVSIAVSILLYLYNAYQGDSTLFMLAAVVTLMVFNGGDADGAFLYGVDRTLLTAFGVLVYTLVASFLWPVKINSNTEALAVQVSQVQGLAFSALIQPTTPEPDIIENMLTKNEQFQAHFVSVRYDDEQILSYREEWDTIASGFEQFDAMLTPALQSASLNVREYQKHITNYDAVISNIEGLLEAIGANWNNCLRPQEPDLIEFTYNVDSLRNETHLTVAAVVARADLLLKLQKLLLNLLRTTNSLLFNERGFEPTPKFLGKPSFIWFDTENLKTAIRAFVVFWISTAVWITFNPPGGFTFVTLSTAFVVLVSYTPVHPKLLYILFTLGFLFAVPAYVFLLPQMTHWLQLGIFIFSYAFIGFYVFAGPLSIFFLLGLMTLGIANTMSYNFNVILIIILLFYMTCTSLLVSVYFPFTSKPQLLYIKFRYRFFSSCEKIIAHTSGKRFWGKHALIGMYLVNASGLIKKMRQWGAMIDAEYYPANPPEKLAAFDLACSVLLEQLKVLGNQSSSFKKNPLVARAQASSEDHVLAGLCNALATPGNDHNITHTFRSQAGKLGEVESRISSLLGENYLSAHTVEELTEFYRYINLQASIATGIVRCKDALLALDWSQLKGKKF
jgi:hypothetical protein